MLIRRIFLMARYMGKKAQSIAHWIENATESGDTIPPTKALSVFVAG